MVSAPVAVVELMCVWCRTPLAPAVLASHEDMEVRRCLCNWLLHSVVTGDGIGDSGIESDGLQFTVVQRAIAVESNPEHRGSGRTVSLYVLLPVDVQCR